MARMAKTPMTAIDVDFNARTRDGLVRARVQPDVLAALYVGQAVTANDPVDGLTADAHVARLGSTSNLVCLDVDWHSFTDAPTQATAAHTA